MDRVSLPGLPEKRAGDFQLDSFDPPRFARVIYTPQESKPDRITIEAQAFEVDANGKFVAFNTGAPSRTNGSIHTINATGVGDTHTLVPAWVRVVGDYNADNLPAGATIASTLPATGNEGDQVYVEPTLYRWDIGMIEAIMRNKAEQLAGLIRNSEQLKTFDL